ncbi:MAG: hypothetical protein ABIG94_08430 [Pseudomonadota bacterium]
MYNTVKKEKEATTYDFIHAGYWLQRERSGKVTAFERFRAERSEDEPPQSMTSGIRPATKRLIDNLSFPQETSEEKGQDTLVLKPFIEVDFLLSLEKIEIIEEAIAIARLAGFEYTANRLGQILSFQEELEPGEQPLSLPSLKQFIRFLIEHSDLREPSIVATDRGNVKAIWEYSEKQIFWIEFYPSGDVRYLAFVPNERRSDRVERTAAWSTASDVFERAQSLGATAWMVL